MEKVFVVQKLAKKLWGTEAAVDAALVEASELMRDVLQARGELKVSSTFAGEIDVKLMTAMQALAEARTAMAGVHAEMDEAKLRLGVRTRMGLEKPPHFAAASDTGALREVG
jgi:hypothetical protein